MPVVAAILAAAIFNQLPGKLDGPLEKMTAQAAARLLECYLEVLRQMEAKGPQLKQSFVGMAKKFRAS